MASDVEVACVAIKVKKSHIEIKLEEIVVVVVNAFLGSVDLLPNYHGFSRGKYGHSNSFSFLS